MERVESTKIFLEKENDLWRYSTFSVPKVWKRNCSSSCTKCPFLLLALQTRLHNNLHCVYTQNSFAHYLIQCLLAKQHHVPAIKTSARIISVRNSTKLISLRKIFRTGMAVQRQVCWLLEPFFLYKMRLQVGKRAHK